MCTKQHCTKLHETSTPDHKRSDEHQQLDKINHKNLNVEPVL